MNRCDTGARTGLVFFGTISASISHELKNALAIINESAGLIEDFTLMAQKGLPLDPERLKTVAGRIQKQIQRADGIVKNMNRFAHSVDDPLKEIDLQDTLYFMSSLAHRLADRQSVTLEPAEAKGGVQILTDPFRLQNLLWHCIRFLLPFADSQKRIRMTIEEGAEEVRIQFSGAEGFVHGVPDTFPGEEEKILLDALGARLLTEKANERLVVALPKQLQP
ncbi:histidine kinase dimerization/phospho-acceptor domain-containing protein [Desulfatiglans anilini]|uniref:histidine kinase dimerization/phospho-acceptor domain-containing protein n=1 Tax=Desulfatiglans anilini TaxID=90728 RepID=UPI0006864FB9|nr:histidine kinase dimerization/phospho-acceptor domain-containing protein [Desulfatiglans anilini]